MDFNLSFFQIHFEKFEVDKSSVLRFS